MKRILLISVVALAALMSSQGQDLKSNTGCSITFMQPAGKYTVLLTSVPRSTAINLLVDYSIKGKSPDPQQVGVYIVEYFEQHYRISLDEREQPRPGYPVDLKTLEEVKKNLKAALKN
jgi:hypothetical protein